MGTNRSTDSDYWLPLIIIAVITMFVISKTGCALASWQRTLSARTALAATVPLRVRSVNF